LGLKVKDWLEEIPLQSYSDFSNDDEGCVIVCVLLCFICEWTQ